MHPRLFLNVLWAFCIDTIRFYLTIVDGCSNMKIVVRRIRSEIENFVEIGMDNNVVSFYGSYE